MARVPFGEWLPDTPNFMGGASDVSNVLARPSGGYGPFKTLVAFSDALSETPLGVVCPQDADATSRTYAGSATKLWRLGGTDPQNWTDFTRGGGAYSTVGWWDFAAYGDLLVGTNNADAVQSITMSTDSAFADLGGSPPLARCVGVVREFVVLGYTADGPNFIEWCASGDATGWTPGTNECDLQELKTGEEVMAIFGGETGYVFQRHAITRMTRVAAPVTFQLDQVVKEIGLYAPRAGARLGGIVYYLSHLGFFAFDGETAEPIGDGKVDRTVLADLNLNYLTNITTAVDYANKVVLWGYPSVLSTDGTPDTIVAYNVTSKRWTTSAIPHRILLDGHTGGVTLEDLDKVSTSIDALPFSLDSAAWIGGNPLIGAFGTDSKLGFFTGDNMEATITTQEAQPFAPQRSFVSDVLPLVDSEEATIAVGSRERQSDAVVWSSEADMESTGSCPVLASGRYVRARLTLPEGAVWTEAQGVDFNAVADGLV